MTVLFLARAMLPSIRLVARLFEWQRMADLPRRRATRLPCGHPGMIVELGARGGYTLAIASALGWRQGHAASLAQRLGCAPQPRCALGPALRAGRAGQSFQAVGAVTNVAKLPVVRQPFRE